VQDPDRIQHGHRDDQRSEQARDQDQRAPHGVSER
jgi:hypothetical protein